MNNVATTLSVVASLLTILIFVSGKAYLPDYFSSTEAQHQNNNQVQQTNSEPITLETESLFDLTNIEGIEYYILGGVLGLIFIWAGAFATSTIMVVLGIIFIPFGFVAFEGWVILALTVILASFPFTFR